MSQKLNSLAPNFVNKYENRKECAEEYKKREKTEIECEPVEPCNDSFGFGWLGVLILWFIIFTVLFWLIFYSLAPSWTLNQDGTINTGKVLLASIIAAIILVIIIWLIKSCIDYSR